MLVVIRLESDFDAQVSKPKVVIDFTASWCGPCKMIAPKYEAFCSQYPSIVFLKVDVDEQPAITQKYGIEAMPTFIFLQNGQKVDQLTGASVGDLENKIKALAAK